MLLLKLERLVELRVQLLVLPAQFRKRAAVHYQQCRGNNASGEQNHEGAFLHCGLLVGALIPLAPRRRISTRSRPASVSF